MHFLLLLMSSLFSLCGVEYIYNHVLKMAKIKGMVDNPNSRKLQKRPVPLLGGVAVFFGVILGMLVYAALIGVFMDKSNPTWMDIAQNTTRMLPLMLGATAILYVGMMDDMLGLSANTRIIIEIVALLGQIFGSGMCIDSFHGLWGIESFSWWIGVPLTVFAGVGLINAYNMVDGVNGLSSGLCIFSSASFALILWRHGDTQNCALALCYGASLIPFFMHNIFGKKSKMFIGNAGTMVMGLLVTWFVIRIMSSTNPIYAEHEFTEGEIFPGAVAMVLSVTSVPVADTLRVMFGRIREGRSPFEADRTHLHHAFIGVNATHFLTSMSVIGMNFTIGVIWILTYVLGLSPDMQFYIVVGVTIIFVWGSSALLRYYGRHNVRNFLTENLEKGIRARMVRSPLIPLVENWLDKGAYEDYKVTLCEASGRRLEELSFEEKQKSSIINSLQGRRNTSLEEIIMMTGMTEETATNYTESLIKDGILAKVGNTRMPMYKVADLKPRTHL